MEGKKEREGGGGGGIMGCVERERFLEVELSVGERMHLCTLVGFC